VAWNEELSQIATLVKLPSGAYEAKEYEFKLQVGARLESGGALALSRPEARRVPGARTSGSRL
jgi:hypothetical protein